MRIGADAETGPPLSSTPPLPLVLVTGTVTCSIFPHRKITMGPGMRGNAGERRERRPSSTLSKGAFPFVFSVIVSSTITGEVIAGAFEILWCCEEGWYARCVVGWHGGDTCLVMRMLLGASVSLVMRKGLS